MNKKVTSIIIEDHALTRIGLKTTIEESKTIEVIGEAEDGLAGVNICQTLNPDVVIMDLGLPVMNGIEATKEIKKINPATKIIILTSHDDENEILGAVESGADAYCLKDIPPKKLVSVIENIAQGGVWLDAVVAKTIFRRLTHNNTCEIQRQRTESAPITDREVEILQLLANGQSNIDIASSLKLSQHTVKSHICNILQKLVVDDRTQAVAKALRSGWIK